MRKFHTILLALAIPVVLAVTVVTACDGDTDSPSSAPVDAPTTRVDPDERRDRVYAAIRHGVEDDADPGRHRR